MGFDPERVDAIDLFNDRVLGLYGSFGKSFERSNFGFEFSFAWGQFFGGLNPYTYFNDTFENSADTNNLVLPGDAEGNDIILPEGVTVSDAGDLADFVLGLIEKIGTLDVKVTITATLAE